MKTYHKPFNCEALKCFNKKANEGRGTWWCSGQLDNNTIEYIKYLGYTIDIHLNSNTEYALIFNENR